jgi:type VI secretion system protein ImpL
MILPMATGRNDEAAAQIGQLAQRELGLIRGTLRVNCPVFALVSDLENTSGFRELAARLTDDQRDRRMGQRFPLVPDVEPAGRTAMITKGVQQIGNRLIPNLVSNLWRIETGGETSYAEALQANIELYHLLGGVRGSQGRIAKALCRAAVPEGAAPVMLGGCYFAATGGDSANEQAFIPGVIRRLVENQDFVAWTPAAVEEDQGFRRWTQAGYAMVGLGVLLAIALIAYRFYQRGGGS